MNTLRERIHTAGIEFIANGDKLKVRAPGTIPPDLIVDLRACRADLLDQYNERAAIMQFDAGLDRDEAERRAAGAVLGGSGQLYGSFRRGVGPRVTALRGFARKRDTNAIGGMK